MSDRYDVIFLGLEAGNAEAKSRLAAIFKVDEQKMDAMLKQNREIVVNTGASLEVAKNYRSIIVSAGGNCRYQPSKTSNSSLALVPKEEADAENKFRCPACKYSATVDNKASIKVCPECGVIPAKYDQVKKIKEEREKIKRQLLAVNQHRADIDAKERKHLEEEKRRKELEDEICKELGIPRYLTNRMGIFSSAAMMLVMGASMGVGGMMLYDTMLEDEVVAVSSTTDGSATNGTEQIGTSGSVAQTHSAPAGAPDPVELALATPGSGSFDMNDAATPGQQAMMQVAAITKNMGITAMPPSSAGASTGNVTLPVSGSMGNINLTGTSTFAQQAANGAVNTAAKASSYQLDNTFHAVLTLEQDPDWDLTLSKAVRLSLRKARLNESFSFASQVSDQSTKLDLMSQIGLAYVNKNKYQLFRDKIVALKIPADRVRSKYQQSLIFSRMALTMAQASKPKLAGKFLTEAEVTAKLLPARELAIATGFIAAAQTGYAESKVSNATFRRANKSLDSVVGIPERLAGFVELSEAYAQSGDRLGALAICERIIQAADKILIGAERESVFSSIVPVIANIDSVETALNIAGRIKTDTLHDQALYELMTNEILANHIYAAMSVADQFNSSAYKAKAFSLIARIQTDSALQPMANENFKRALAFANDLSSQPQAVALSEIARYQTLSGNHKAGAKLMDRSLFFVKDIKNRKHQDRIYSAIVKNQVRSGSLIQATQTASLISDSKATKTAFNQIGNTRKVLNTLKSNGKALSLASRVNRR